MSAPGNGDAVQNDDVPVAFALDQAHRAVDLLERAEAGRQHDRQTRPAGRLQEAGIGQVHRRDLDERRIECHELV